MSMSKLPEVGLDKWRQKGGVVWWEAEVGEVSVVVSRRGGGGSAPPYDGMNLGLHVGDAEEAVRANWEGFGAATGGAAAPVLGEQVHGAAVATVGMVDVGRGWRGRE